MKIVFLVDRWSNGGVPTVMENLTKSLSDKHEFIWIFYYEGKKTALNNRQIELNARFSGDPRALISLRKHLKQENPDIIHDHFGGIWSAGYLFSAWRKKAVLHYHNEFDTIKDSPDNRRIFKEGFFKRMLLPRYSKIVAVSRHNVQTIQKYLGEKKKVEVIPNGVEITDVSSLNQKKRDKFIIGFLGRLVFEKGVDSLIESLANTENRNSFEVQIAGDGNEEYIQSLKQLISDNQLNNVEFLGRVEDTQSFFSGIDVMYFGSRQEPFGLTILEAWAHQVPVVGFYPENGGGPFEIMNSENPKAGFLFKERNTSLFADFLKECQSDPEKIIKWKSECAKQIAPYDSNKIGEIWNELYKEVVGK